MSTLFDSGIRPVIDGWLLEKSKEERSYGDYWSASSAGYCYRKQIFQRLGVPKVEKESDGRKQRVFTSGHLFHSWIQGITKEAGLSIAQEIELQDETLMIRGHIDDLVLVKQDQIMPGQIIPFKGKELRPEDVDNALQHLILYDYKTVNSRAFMWAKKKGNAMSYYHRLQLGTYMYMLRKTRKPFTVRLDPDTPSELVRTYDTTSLTEARILKIEKDSLMMGEQQLMWSEELESDVFDYWNGLNAYWKNKKLPPCTCHEQENGFLAKEQYNDYFYNGEPCSIEYYKLFKEGKLSKEEAK